VEPEGSLPRSQGLCGNNETLKIFHTVTNLINVLPVNGSVNTVQHTAKDESVFSVVRATPSAGNGPMNSLSDK
jgi:hypothetical protein